MPLGGKFELLGDALPLLLKLTAGLALVQELLLEGLVLEEELIAAFLQGHKVHIRII